MIILSDHVYTIGVIVMTFWYVFWNELYFLNYFKLFTWD